MCAKCSVCPASWKSARQSSGPPCGLITRMTRSGTSIGTQNARGDLFGRSSRSSSTFFCERRSTPRSASVASSAGTIRSSGNDLVPLTPRKTRATSQRSISPSPSPMRLRKKRSPASSHSRSVESRKRAALVGEIVERILEAAVELCVVRLRRAARSRGGRPGASGCTGSLCSSVASFRARSRRSRCARSSVFACAGAGRGRGSPRRRP